MVRAVIRRMAMFHPRILPFGEEKTLSVNFERRDPGVCTNPPSENENTWLLFESRAYFVDNGFDVWLCENFTTSKGEVLRIYFTTGHFVYRKNALSK